MRHAQTAPVLGTVLLALAATAGGIYAKAADDRGLARHRLVLHTYAEPNAIYLTAWHRGDVRVTLDGDKLRPIRFTMRAAISDGCRWLGIETLEPLDSRTYSYRYDERILDCDPDAKPARKTPRTGIVVVIPD